VPWLRPDGGRLRPAAVLGAAGWRAVRYREDKPADLERARAEVAAWREANPQGTAGQLFAGLGGRFHPGYGPVLRAILFAEGRHAARAVTGITGASR